MSATQAWFAVTLPPGPGGSALSVIDVGAEDAPSLDDALRRIGAGGVPIGEARVRRIAGADDGVVARINDCHAMLIPHGSERIVRVIGESLLAAGFCNTAEAPALYPEAANLVEACMLEALARAASPLAVDLLLAQPAAWRRGPAPNDERSRERSRVLRRLIDPPSVAAVGYANVGKSTLLNALARRSVSIVSPEAGTTRDHVGATLELAGLTVHWFDTPGVRSAGGEDAIESQAMRVARDRVAGAQLVVVCGDAEHGFVDPVAAGGGPVQLVIRCATKADRGVASGADVVTAAERGDGLEALAMAVRHALVPRELLSDPAAWHFHPLMGDSQVAD